MIKLIQLGGTLEIRKAHLGVSLWRIFRLNYLRKKKPLNMLGLNKREDEGRSLLKLHLLFLSPSSLLWCVQVSYFMMPCLLTVSETMNPDDHDNMIKRTVSPLNCYSWKFFLVTKMSSKAYFLYAFFDHPSIPGSPPVLISIPLLCWYPYYYLQNLASSLLWNPCQGTLSVCLFRSRSPI